MISSLLKLVVNFAIGIFLILFIQNYFDFTPNFPNTYLFLGVFGWLLVGTMLGRYHYRNTSLYGAWIHPTNLITAPIGFGILLTLTLLSVPEIQQTSLFHLLWLVVPSLIFSWIIAIASIKFGNNSTPQLLPLITIAHIQALIIFSGFAFLYLDGRSPQLIFVPKTTTHYLLTFITMIAAWGLTALYVNLLKSFEFYQKAEHMLSKTSGMDYETKRMIATHEAGHCLVYCFFKTPPPQIKIYLYEKALSKDENAYGLVQAVIPVLKTKEYKVFTLLVLLAGQRAELALHKKTSKGASSDVAKWKAAAHTFLATHNKKYFEQPENEMQMLQNSELENELFNQHTQILDTFFAKNKSLLSDLAAKAYRFNPLEAHQIHPYLAKAKITKDFPIETKKKLW